VVPHSISPTDGTVRIKFGWMTVDLIAYNLPISRKVIYLINFQVGIEMHIADTMYKLNKQVHPTEVIVGWWTTGCEVHSIAVPINEYYARQCQNPVHLLVDTSLRNKKMSIKGFVQYVR